MPETDKRGERSGGLASGGIDASEVSGTSSILQLRTLGRAMNRATTNGRSL